MKLPTFANTVTRIAIFALLMPAGLLAAQTADSAAITKLFDEVKAHAANAEEDAATLQSFTMSSMHRTSHGNKLSLIKEHVNALIRDGNQLSSMRDQGSPWQQEAIDRISSLLPEMAVHLTATINHLNENPSQTQMQPYHNYVDTNYELISKAHHVISDVVDYGEAKAKAESLEKELQLAAASNAGA